MRQYRGKKSGDWRNIYRKVYYKYLIKRYLKKCEQVLDVGCGNGLFMRCAKSLGLNIQGIDIDPKVKNSDVIIGDFLTQDFNQTYDVIFSSMVLEHVDHFKFMEKVQKICTKKLIIITERPTKKFWDSPNHIRPYTKITLKLLLEDFGFKVLYLKNLYPTRALIVIGIKK